MAAESELKKFGQFVDDFSEKLRASLKHNQVLKLDSQLLPCLRKNSGLALVSSPREGVTLPGLVFSSTDNTMLGKVILALAAITQEIDFLISENELKKKFLDPILLYGTEAPGKLIKYSALAVSVKA